MKEVRATVYEAVDGRRFTTEEQCARYERTSRGCQVAYAKERVASLHNLMAGMKRDTLPKRHKAYMSALESLRAIAKMKPRKVGYAKIIAAYKEANTQNVMLADAVSLYRKLRDEVRELRKEVLG